MPLMRRTVIWFWIGVSSFALAQEPDCHREQELSRIVHSRRDDGAAP